MRRWLLALVALYAAPCAGQVLPGHRLPEGPERPVRERAFHIERYKAELFVDLDKEQISGTATLTVVSLREPLAELALDAANLSVSRIEREGKPQAFRVDEKSWKLAVALDPPLPMGRATTVFESYSDPKYRQEVRLAALDGWEKAAPGDPRLAERLRQFTPDRNRNVRQEAIRRLGELHHESDLPLFQRLALDPDPTMAEFARQSIEEIEAFVRAP
jgi:hypothetical protein